MKSRVGEIKLEVGKIYKTRCGGIVKVTYDHNEPIFTMDVRELATGKYMGLYTREGKCSPFPDSENSADIVEEITC